jgi:hypothetical protein
MGTKKVRILERVGNPNSGVIIQPGAVVELPEGWADRYIAQGKAEFVGGYKSKSESADEAAPAAKPEKKAAKGKK